MFPSLSASGLLSDLSADATTIAFDLPDGGYDKLHAFLESSNALPSSKRGRITLIALMLLASRIVKQQLGPLGPVASYLNEIKDDAIREEAKRILESVHAHPAGPAVIGEDAFWEIDTADRAKLLQLYAALDEDGKRRLRSHLTGTTAVRLAALASVPLEQIHLLLDLLGPAQPNRPAPTPSVAENAVNGVTGFFFPWMRRAHRGVSS